MLYKILRFLLPCIVAATSCAQEAVEHPKQVAPTPELVPLGEVSSVQIPSLPADGIGAPLLCDPEGRIVFRLATPEAGIEDPVSVSADGKTVIRFGKEKINDVDRPIMLSVFLMFVVHFKPDGTYAGAVPLELPFQPTRFGVFEDGDFLISGADPATDEPRVAIAAPNGQLRRLLELKGDVHAQKESSSSEEGSDPTALPRFKPAPDRSKQSFATGTLRGVVSTSQITKDGSNLLLFRPRNGPVFSISPSGEVSVRRLKVDGDYRLYTIKVVAGLWIVEFLHSVPNSAAVELSTYAFDPESGVPQRKYFFPPDTGWGLACADGNELTFIVADENNKGLRIIKLAPGANPH